MKRRLQQNSGASLQINTGVDQPQRNTARTR